MFTKEDTEFMLEALKEAKIALLSDDVPIGAIITLNGQIIGRGHNLSDSRNDITLHAEMNAIKDAQKNIGNKRLDEATIYITLEPCYMCQGAIYLSKIKRIVYALKNEKENLYSSSDLFLSPNLAYYPTIESGLLKEESKDLLNKYFQKKR